MARSPSDPALTEPGHVIGTPAYMAPERAEGKEADERADIYVLGLILVEMATGQFSRFPKDLPPALERVIRRRLETDPDDRWQSARDLQWELESIGQTPPAALPGSQSKFPAWGLAVAAIAGIALVVFALLRFGQRPVPPPLARMNVLLPEKSLVRSLAVSPDGRFIAVVLVKDGKQQIWIRALDALELAPLAGTDNAADPFWSADSQFIAFFADAKLKKIDHSGGPVQTLCDALAAVGGTWSRNGDILIGALGQVERVSDAGGAIAKLPGHADITELFPAFLPDGRHYVATRNRIGSTTESGLWLESMDGPEGRRILPDVTRAEIVAPIAGGRVGAILFTRAGTLMALPFDMKRLESSGDPFPVAQEIAVGTNSNWLSASSYSGVLAYVSGQHSHWQYVWRDRQGRNLGAVGDAGGVVMISPRWEAAGGRSRRGDYDA